MASPEQAICAELPAVAAMIRGRSDASFYRRRTIVERILFAVVGLYMLAATAVPLGDAKEHAPCADSGG